MSDKMRVLVTGASGQIGQVFARFYADMYSMRLAYRSRSIEARPGHEAMQIDLTDYDSVLSAMQGMEAVVHLGADSAGSAPWESVLPNNIVGTYNAYEAAHAAGVPRFVFASSNHAAGYAVLEHGMAGPDAPIRPDSLYGVSKCFGEALGRFYHDRYGMQVICLRIGSCHGLDDVEDQRERLRAALVSGRRNPYDPRQYITMWISNRDMVQLIHKSLQTQCPFGIFYGTSDNEPGMFDLTLTKELLGYEPQDRVQDLLD